jgi:hypothetical protein
MGFPSRLRPRVSSVRPLLLSRSPSTVFWRVGAVIVDAVNAVIGARSMTHVIQKSRKVGDPSFTYCDASAAPIGVPVVVGVQAPLLEVSPRLVLRRVYQAVSVLPGSGLLCAEASARGRQATPKTRPRYDFLDSAGTTAEPLSCSVRGVLPAAYHAESPKYFTGEIDELSHSRILPKMPRFRGRSVEVTA